MRVFVLGGTRVERALGAPVDLGARKPRSIVAALAMRPGRPVPVDLLADLVWAGEPPPAAHGALHAYISGLRKALEPERRGRSAPSVLGRTDHGYVLSVPQDAVDAHRFAGAVRDAERSLAPLGSQLSTGPAKDWPSHTEVVCTLERLDEALGLWVGEPYADLPDHADVLAERASLERLRAAAEEARLLGLLALGEHVNVLATTQPLTALHPTRERLHALHALALVRGGRQVEALDHLRRARAQLAEELGLDPGRALRDVEQAVLRQEAGLLEWLRPAPSTSGTPSPRQVPSVRPATPDAAPPAAGSHDGVPVAGTAVAAAGEATSMAGPEEPIGRTEERDALAQLLSDSLAGRARSALLVGEPGIGKSWLVRDLTDRARGLGFVVASGSCSQDDGAPPLWPWLSVLRTLDEPAANGGGDRPGGGSGGSQATGPGGLADVLPDTADLGPGRSAFQTWERVASAVLAAAGRVPVLVVLDDLHWADDATLRALRHLLEVTPQTARLVVVGTRRSHPEPNGPLAEVGEAFVRRQALRLDLVGLPGTDAAELVHSIAAGVPAAVIDEWHTRTGGNPFFLLELARLGPAVSAGPDHGGIVPATVREVVRRRVAQLPPDTIEALATAAVVGRSFRAETVAAAGQGDPDETAERLEPAHAAGLLVDHSADGFAFAHALARDAVYLSIPQRRRARVHAQIAHALATDESLRTAFTPDELTAELARHWLASGPSHAEQAWQAADAAATQARRAAAYRDAMRMRSEAVAAHRRVPGASEEQRWDLLLELARDAAYAAHWPQVVDAALEAVALGRSLGSPDRVARAAAAISHYCVWMPHSWLEVFEDAVDDLRWALRNLPEHDSATRALLLLSLAVELYYDPTAPAERAALVEAGLAMARRLADPALLSWAARAAGIASWLPSRTVARLAVGAEGVAAARAAKDYAAEAVLLLGLAVDHLELGRFDEWKRLSADAARIGLRERLPFVNYTYNWVELGLAALRGDDAEAQRRADVALDLASQVALPAEHLAKPVISLMVRVWRPLTPADVTLFRLMAHEPMARATAHALLGRAGRPDLVAEEMRDHPYEVGQESWQTLLTECLEAEASSHVGDRAMARRTVAELEPYSGRVSLAGVSVVIGPVDGYLALAQVTAGDLDAGRRSAARAFADAERWGFTAYTEWLTRNLGRLGVDAEALAP